MGALCYLAAWDARRAKLFDRCAPADGIVPVDQLVEQFMSVEPYSKAQRVFVIVDNGSAHRGKASIKRLQGRYRNRILVHTPVHASWLNQAEIYFSIVQRKVLTPSQSTKRRLRSDQPTRRLGGDGRGGRAGGSAREVSPPGRSAVRHGLRSQFAALSALSFAGAQPGRRTTTSSREPGPTRRRGTNSRR
jgi:hypothetical protein